MGSEINPPVLKAQLRKARLGTTRSSFVLDVAIESPPGITIVFGPSGAGKSTLLDCIAGLLRPDDGRIEIDGEVLLDVERRVDVPPAKRKIAYVFQSLALFPHMTVEQNVGYGLADMPRPERALRVTAMLEAFRVEQLAKRKADEISGGEQQRVALARSLATSPRVLLLDEPLTALDEGLKKSIMEDLRRWNAAQNIPILYVTHSRAEVDALGESVIVLEHGKIISTGTPHEVLDAPRRSSLAQASGFENLFSCVVTELREADGVMRVQLVHGGCEIETPLGHATAGTAVRLAIRAGDILLATERPYGLSARNVMAGRIIWLEQRGKMFVARVAADADGAVVFTVHLTLGAKRALELEVNRPVWLALKTHSCHVLED
ncbi:MAG TPA: molybdenum ABC transporter ATP-binding protein [Candidatus Acidoferrum sp.]|nr:molybdenum ABC transporter ATP-binding protein [Candidatus Acidoferrum sp.]